MASRAVSFSAITGKAGANIGSVVPILGASIDPKTSFVLEKEDGVVLLDEPVSGATDNWTVWSCPTDFFSSDEGTPVWILIENIQFDGLKISDLTNYLFTNREDVIKVCNAIKAARSTKGVSGASKALKNALRRTPASTSLSENSSIRVSSRDSRSSVDGLVRQTLGNTENNAAAPSKAVVPPRRKRVGEGLPVLRPVTEGSESERPALPRRQSTGQASGNLGLGLSSALPRRQSTGQASGNLGLGLSSALSRESSGGSRGKSTKKNRRNNRKSRRNNRKSRRN